MKNIFKNKKILLGAAVFAVLAVIIIQTSPFSAIGGEMMPNPSAIYCDAMGGEWDIIEDNGQIGMCIFSDVKCEAWDFYEGKCGQEHNHCGTFGSFTATEGCKYSRECAECYDIICITGECPDIRGKQSWEIVAQRDCPSVCTPLWQAENGKCIFNECGSGCGADHIKTFDTKGECEILSKEYSCWSINKDATGCIHSTSFNACAIESPCPLNCVTLESCEQYVECAEEGEWINTQDGIKCCDGLVPELTCEEGTLQPCAISSRICTKPEVPLTCEDYGYYTNAMLNSVTSWEQIEVSDLTCWQPIATPPKIIKVITDITGIDSKILTYGILIALFWIGAIITVTIWSKVRRK